MLSLHFLDIHVIFVTQCGIYFSTAPFVCANTLPRKQISLISALGYGFFGTITHTMMTAMIYHSHPHSDSEDSDSPQPPPSTSHTKSPPSKSKNSTYHPNIKSKLLSLSKEK